MSDKGYLLGKKILESLPALVETLEDDNVNRFQKQENLEKIFLGLDIVHSLTAKNLLIAKHLLEFY